MNKFLFSSTVALGAIVATAIPIKPAHALSFGFQNIFPVTKASESSGDTIVNQFSLDVSNFGSNQVLFKLSNSGSTQSFIGDFYFDDNGLLANPNLTAGLPQNSGDVNFKVPNGKFNFPQGNKVSFNADFGFRADSPGSEKQGIDLGEMYAVVFDGSYNNVITALQNGNLRVGIHVQGIGGDGGPSDSFVNNPTPVPTPALLPGLIGMGVAALRKRKQQEAKATAEA